jgi:hypothetical protein
MSTIQEASKSGKPWYREPWPWILFGLPGIVVIASLTTYAIAYWGIGHHGGADALVVDDYYIEGLGINQTLARNRQALSLGISGRLHLDGGGAELVLTATDNSKLPNQLILTATHATRPELDQKVVLNKTMDSYRGVMHPLPAGRWQLQIEDQALTWRIASVVKLPADSEIELRAWLDDAGS